MNEFVTSIALMTATLLIAVVKALEKPIKDRARYLPATAYVTYAVLVFLIGGFSLFAPLVCRNRGEAAYRDDQYNAAAEHLSIAANSVFVNADVLVHLSFSHKMIGDKAPTSHQKRHSYSLSLDQSARAWADYDNPYHLLNALDINLRLGEWGQATESIATLLLYAHQQSDLQGTGRETWQGKQLADAYITVANAYSELDYPGRDPEKAIQYLEKAREFDPGNSGVKVRLAARYMDLVHRCTEPDEIIAYLQLAWSTADDATELKLDPKMKFLLYITILDILVSPLVDRVPRVDLTVGDVLVVCEDLLEGIQETEEHLDPRAWFIMAEGYVSASEPDYGKARDCFRRGALEVAALPCEALERAIRVGHLIGGVEDQVEALSLMYEYQSSQQLPTDPSQDR